MVYRRQGTKRFSFEARTPTGFTQLPTGVTDRILANKIAGMWQQLAEKERAWDVLRRVLEAPPRRRAEQLRALYDRWVETAHVTGMSRVDALRHRLEDVDLEPLVNVWAQQYRQRYPRSAAHALNHVRRLLPPGTVRLRSAVTVEWLTAQLYNQADAPKASTLRKIAANWSAFLGWCARVHGLFPSNPMTRVDLPPVARPPIDFYELEQVEAIVAAQPTPMRQALFAVIYGSGVDVSDVLERTRGELLAGTKELRAAGTKAHTRDRIVRVADWAWPYLWSYAKTLLPMAPLFPGVSRYTASDWHRATVAELGLRPALPLKKARHHWAVRFLRAGGAVEVARRQLGHGTAKLTLDTYGAWIPTGADRDAMEARVTAYDSAQRRANTGERGG